MTASKMSPVASAVIVAAGGSSRMGFDKLAAPLGGRPVLAHALAAFAAAASIAEIVLVTSPERCAGFEELLAAAARGKPARVVAGGAHRQESVGRGLGAARPDLAIIAVHDGARPFISPEQIDACVAGASDQGAVSLAAPVVETLQRAAADGRMLEGIDREGLWAMQTPQVFRRELLARALAAAETAGMRFTDETSAVRAIGEPVYLIPNDGWNPKITYPRDLELAIAWLEARP
jgi:2-C-methyl-D-erythritol 4-phosphate cytidylyltransferase